MNCKQGEMAFIVKSECGNEGKIVTCVEYLGKCRWANKNSEITIEDTWRIDRFLPNWGSQFSMEICDDQLRPIRPGDLNETTDERKEVTA